MSSHSFFHSYRKIIPDFNHFLESLYQPFPGHLRVNRIKIKPEYLIARLAKKDIFLKKSIKSADTLYHTSGLESPGKLLEYYSGYIHSQALTSCLASIALSPEPGSYVLDMCSSPGGKSTHLADLMGNTGLIVANELYPSRHISLAETVSRLGVINVVLTSYQAQEFPLRQKFNYILADVPCSGAGRVRINSRNEKSGFENMVVRKKLLDLQRKIIIRGFDLLAEGGEMLYSTCTYNPEENESVVNYLLQSRDADLLPINNIDSYYEPGITKWRDEIYDRRMELTARFYPHQINSVGFFMARISRR